MKMKPNDVNVWISYYKTSFLLIGPIRSNTPEGL